MRKTLCLTAVIVCNVVGSAGAQLASGLDAGRNLFDGGRFAEASKALWPSFRRRSDWNPAIAEAKAGVERTSSQ